MVIVGIHHGGRIAGLHELINGSVSRRLTGQAHCSVLVVTHYRGPLSRPAPHTARKGGIGR
jgi:hypothetical protein